MIRPPVGFSDQGCGSKEARPHRTQIRSARPWFHNQDKEHFEMTITIGIDPHKASHTAVAIDNTECVLDEIRVRASAK